jgi:tRNA(fMet)-specific endonuclease VapC
MSFLLDTNVFSAIVRGEPKPTSRLLSLVPSEVFVPQPVVAEIRYGLARLPRSRRRSALELRCTRLLGAVRRAEWTDEVSERFGALRAQLEQIGQRLDDFDAAIAAHALAMNAILATANVRHFGRVEGLALEDWLA